MSHTSLKWFSCILFLSPWLVEASIHQYSVKIDRGLSSAIVKACFDGDAPNYLAVENKLGNKDLLRFPHSDQGNIEIQGRYWKTKNLSSNACLSYQVSIQRYHAKRSPLSKRRKAVAYIENNTWLWLPELVTTEHDIEVTFDLPLWANISTPWHKINKKEHRYRIGQQPQEWGYTLMIGDFDVDQYPIADDSIINIASIKGMKKKPEIHKWIADAANSLESYLGFYPVKNTQVIVIAKTKKKNGPVPWGRLQRGNGMGLLFVVVPEFPIDDFYRDWTATHEFTHQLLPNINWEDKWLSEGLASYLEYVLMAQSNWITKEEAWYALYKGLKRGEKGTKKTKREPLKETMNNRQKNDRTGRTMRIYWSGALFFMKADLKLRELSNNKVGLNHILNKLNRCCELHEEMWSGSRLTAKLDELSESDIFSELYKEFREGVNFPEYEDTLNRLGVIVSKDESLLKQLSVNSIAHKIMK